jgi:V-type H+-transporting ATPase subunit H
MTILSGLNLSSLKSPVVSIFSQVQWDSLSMLKLTAQETALLRMAETNPVDYTLADSRDASMYARVLLKLAAEAYAAGAGSGEVSRLSDVNSAGTVLSSEEQSRLLEVDPVGVVSHYALSKLLDILVTLSNGQVRGVSVASVFYVGKEGVLVDQWKSLLRILNHKGSRDMYAPKMAALALTAILVTACPSQRQSRLVVTEDKKPATGPTSSRTVSYASAQEPLEAVISWTMAQLKVSSSIMNLANPVGNPSIAAANNNSNSRAVALCLPALRVLLEAPETRALLAQAGAVKYLTRQVRLATGSSSKKNVEGVVPATGTAASVAPDMEQQRKGTAGTQSVQQLYEVCFALWILTYELDGSYKLRADFAKCDSSNHSVVQALVDLVGLAPREKVVRVALASLHNLAICSGTNTESSAAAPPAGATEYAGFYFLNEMIACGLMKYIGLLRNRQFTDPDLVNDVKVLHQLLTDNYHEMSRWEVYKNEVESGHLRWGSTHTEAFFKENAKMLEGPDGDFRLLKVLIALVSSRDPEVCAVACYDIGEFVRHYPNGRAIAKRLGAKEVVMPLIEHASPVVQRHALQCVSKIMVQNWQHVGGIAAH